MFQSGKQRLFVRLLMLVVLVTCLILLSYGKDLSRYLNIARQQAIAPMVLRSPQPDSPLLISPTYIDSSNPLSPRYGYSITNISDKPIRAFTIQESVSLDAGAPIVSTTFSHLPAMKLFLMSHDLRQEEGGRGSTYQHPPIKVELSVDFVEFADGTRWGIDTSNSGDRLDGIRGGGKAAIKKYREILANEGASALEQAMMNSDLIQPERPPKSEMWAEGFKTGVNFVKNRLIEAKAKKGQGEVVRELTKSFDSTEGRQEP